MSGDMVRLRSPPHSCTGVPVPASAPTALQQGALPGSIHQSSQGTAPLPGPWHPVHGNRAPTSFFQGNCLGFHFTDGVPGEHVPQTRVSQNAPLLTQMLKRVAHNLSRPRAPYSHDATLLPSMTARGLQVTVRESNRARQVNEVVKRHI